MSDFGLHDDTDPWSDCTLKANCPEYSVTPQLCMRESTSLTASGFNTMSPVRGQTPPLAKVAAITDKLLQSVSSEEHCNTEDTGHGALSSFTILLQLTSKLLPLPNKLYVDNLVEGFSVSE